ncbi:MAG: alpha/beta fold hydrolase [Acidobacteriales bacterium]|nr:alpha/beta fold hydrolase [Terriglobales bacterium]
MAGEIKSLFISGPVGRLEALLNVGEPNVTHCALVCHPHPMFGGRMHNKVVFALAKALNGFGFPVLRFNFRGADLSEGEHDFGRGEVEDVRAALNWLDREFHLPIILAGFSFGGAIGSRAACPDARVAAVIVAGMPVSVDNRVYDYSFLRDCRKPKLFVSGGQDEFGPRAELETIVAAAAEPKKLAFVGDVDHYFAGKLDELRRVVEKWVRDLGIAVPR